MSEQWEIEPKRKHWIDATTGLDCLIVRHPHGLHLCGYVGVPKGSPYYGTEYDNVDVGVHGGLTYAAKCSDHVCHHEPQDTIACADVWWLGFDCAHLGDLSPGFNLHSKLSGDYEETYKDMGFVATECAALAKQLVGTTVRHRAHGRDQ